MSVLWRKTEEARAPKRPRPRQAGVCSSAAAIVVIAAAAAASAPAAVVAAASAVVPAAVPAASSAAAAQEDDDQNDPQAAAVIPVVPHGLFHLTYRSGLYYAPGSPMAAWPAKFFARSFLRRTHKREDMSP